MPNELSETKVEQFKQQEKLETLEVPALETSLTGLAKAGGFDFLEAVVDGSDSMNPVRKAKRNIFPYDYFLDRKSGKRNLFRKIY